MKGLISFVGCFIAIMMMTLGLFSLYEGKNWNVAVLNKEKKMEENKKANDFLNLSEADWKKRLSPEEYRVLREKGTESAFDNKYYNWEEEGSYVCAGCGQPLFSSETKYDSGTGWPSYWSPITPESVDYKEDSLLMMKRIEVLCSKCQSHLGHVFNDGPNPTGKRYCMNSIALKFVPKDSE